MYIHNKALRVTGIVAAVFLSIILVLLLIAVPIYSVAASIVKPSTIVDIVQKIDLAKMVLEDVGTQEDLGTAELDMAKSLTNSRFFKETIALYTEQTADVLTGKDTDAVITEADVQALAHEHKEEILDILYVHMPEAQKADKEQIEKEFAQMVEQYSSFIVQSLPDSEALQEIAADPEVGAPISILVNTTVPVVLYAVLGVVAALIFVCLLHQFRGLLCLGIDALIAVLPLAALYALLSKNGLVMTMLAEEEAGALLTSVVTVLGGKVLTAVIVLAVVGVLLIAGYIVYIQLQKNRPTAPEAEAPVLEPPVTE